MELVDKTVSFDAKDDQRTEDEDEKQYMNYSYLSDRQHFNTSQDDEQRILPEELEELPKKRKRRKKRLHLSSTAMESNGNAKEMTAVNTLDQSRTSNEVGHTSLKNLESSEKLQKIKEDHYEVDEGEPTHRVDIRQLALQQAINRSDPANKEKKCHFDYILVHPTGDNSYSHERLRETFEAALEEEGIKIEKKYSSLKTFVVLHCPFERLCIEAEYVVLEMPLAGYVIPEQIGGQSCLSKLGDKLKTDNEVDFVSAPFCVSKKEIYEGIDNPDTFFRPALRSLLVNHILNTIDIRDKESRQLGQNPQGLPYMLLENAYSDTFILHEKSKYDTNFTLPGDDGGDDESFLYGQDITDPRSSLHDTWLRWLKFQPLWKIRNYFGENIALYFAWLGSLTFSLIIPMFFGLAVFLWGLIDAVADNPVNQTNTTLSGLITIWAKNAFDNSFTPYFALIICLWGTIFLEFWKRTNARLAYQWDVDAFEEQEPNRPEFYGTAIRPDPVTGNDESFYPFGRRFIKMMGSFSLLLFMVCLVLASLFAVIVYRIIAREDLFKARGPLGPTIASVTSTFINTCSIMIMGKVYQILAARLTDWENHRTQTSYDDALIIKLFGFQFVNSYTSLFYIAFFRQDTASKGVLGFGPSYNDACGDNNDCMTLLSLQVAMLMIMKPLPKFFTDVVIPFIKRMWRRGCRRNNKVEEAGELGNQFEDFLNYELHKEPPGEFTLSEYTEKVLQYGFLMLFAAAFPLAPLIALATNLIDMKVDGRLLLWVNRRPIARRAQDIGMWYGILEFLNIVGVVTNGFLVTFTSSYGKHWVGYTTTSITNQTTVNALTNQIMVLRTVTQEPTFSRLWLLIGFEHIVFTIEFFLAWLIPDTPSDVRMAQRREKHHIADILAKAGMRKGPGNKLTESSSCHRRLLRSSVSWSPGDVIIPHAAQQNLEPLRESNAGSAVDKKEPRVLRDTSPQASPEKEQSRHHHTSGTRTRLDPLPVNYICKLNNSEMKTHVEKV